MKALDFLNEMLYQGWTNAEVTTVNAQHYNSALELAEQFAGGTNVCFRKGYIYNQNANYSLVWIDSSNSYLFERLTPDFIAESDGQRILFFELA
ncbi:MAG: hypothetical protein HUK06_01505 [Bacteroidaceae bacterium]|nr:hypothetical protein [Bacteroidaceae bacterium]